MRSLKYSQDDRIFKVYYTIKELADIVGINPSSIVKRAKKLKIPLSGGRCYKIHYSYVQRVLDY